LEELAEGLRRCGGAAYAEMHRSNYKQSFGTSHSRAATGSQLS